MNVFLEPVEEFIVAHGLQISSALAILLVGWLFAKIMRRTVRRIMTAARVDPTFGGVRR